jgi:hypothetical protein
MFFFEHHNTTSNLSELARIVEFRYILGLFDVVHLADDRKLCFRRLYSQEAGGIASGFSTICKLWFAKLIWTPAENQGFSMCELGDYVPSPQLNNKWELFPEMVRCGMSEALDGSFENFDRVMHAAFREQRNSW